MRIIFAADMHLSPTHRYFMDNWERFVQLVNQSPPHLVILGGDLSFDGAERTADLAFAAEQVARLNAPVRILAGNHDVGERPKSAKMNKPVTADRFARFVRLFPENRWHIPADGVHLLGINSELLQVDLPETHEQWEWLEGILGEISSPRERPSEGRRGREGRSAEALGKLPLILFSHRPLFEMGHREEEIVGSAIDIPARDRLLRLLAPCAVSLVVSAHVHVFKEMHVGSTEYVWSPALSFISTHQQKKTYGGEHRIGYLEIETSQVSWRIVEPASFIAHDMRNWFSEHRSTTFLPPW